MTKNGRLALSLMAFTLMTSRLLKASAEPSASISVLLRMANNHTAITKEANAIVYIQNISDHIVVEDGSRTQYRIHLQGPAGEPPKTLWYQQVLTGALQVTLSAPPPYIIAPGQSIDRTFVLSAYYDLSLPGKYAVYLEVHDDESGAWIETNKTVFEILSTD